MDNFKQMVEETKKLVQEEIKNKDSRPYYMLDKQLFSILEELDKMEYIRNIDLFCPYYPKSIADCWDYQNPLANRLLELLEVYRKLF